MAQTGISYAAGQLLAVVAPRTVLVVDAPTDWSLAGPLWELALDDAPVDEILDVLVRRGIRTAPSFAIVRVEGDAVRALVRGSVPVCFERTGEPVRLDATGATTWLEGLISGARRVLVGDVETTSELPYLVSTGVVLVSGLALPCGADAAAPDASGELPQVEDIDPAVDSAVDSAVAPSAPEPAFASAAPSPRVVDLTRTAPRPPAEAFAKAEPAPASARAFAPAGSPAGTEIGGSTGLNGHAPAVFDRQRESFEPYERESFEPESFREYAPPAPVAAPAPAPAPAPVEELVEEEEAESHTEAYDPFSGGDSGKAASFFEAASPPAAPEVAEEVVADEEYADDVTYTDDDFDEPGPDVAVEADHREPDPFDDLLIDADERPPGPSPVDLPNFGSPSVPVPPVDRRLPAIEEEQEEDHPRSGFEFPQQGSRIGSAPAAWPPPPAEPEQPAASAAEFEVEEQDEVGFDSLLADNSFRPPAGTREPQHQPSARDLDPYDPLEAYQSEEGEDGSSDPDQPEDDQQPGALPFRVRGQSLRPEQRVPLDQLRGLNGGLSAGLNGRQANRELPPRPEPEPEQYVRDDEPAAAAAVGGAAKPQVAPSPSPSGGLLLPSFFRGARAARKGGAAVEGDAASSAPSGPISREGVNGHNGSPWPAAGAGQAPSAWAPPVRRGMGAPHGDQRPSDGPPAMPGVLRQSPNGTPSIGTSGDGEPPREPPRLLGVWCDAGHVTSPDHDTCRVCGLPVPPQAPILVARPPLGVLVFDNGDRVEVDRPVVLGRDPKPVSSPDPEKPILHPVASATGQVSRTHAEIRASGWDVVVTDLDAMNGTALTLPGQPPIAIEPGVPTVIVPGARVDLGGETGFVFEIEG